MICYHCAKVKDCPKFRRMYSELEDFSVNKCRDYKDEAEYKYKKIAEHDDLMHLIYDYFTEQIEGDFSDEQIVKVITSALWDL